MCSNPPGCSCALTTDGRQSLQQPPSSPSDVTVSCRGAAASTPPRVPSFGPGLGSCPRICGTISMSEPSPLHALLVAVAAPVLLQMLAEGIAKLAGGGRPSWNVTIGAQTAKLDIAELPRSFPAGFFAVFAAAGIDLSLVMGGGQLGLSSHLALGLSDTDGLLAGGIGLVAAMIWVACVWTSTQWGKGRSLVCGGDGETLEVGKLRFPDSAVCAVFSFLGFLTASAAMALPVWALTT